MALFLLISVFCTIMLLVALLVLDQFPYRILRRLWANKQRERAISFADEFPIAQGDIVFLGDTHMADFRWEEHFPGQPIRNLGIPDETVAELVQRLPAIIANKPKQILLHTGGTDIRLAFSHGQTMQHMDVLLKTMQHFVDHHPADHYSQETAVVICEVLPQRRHQAKKIQRLNLEFAERATYFNMTFVELFDDFADNNGGLSAQYTEDGYHLWGAGYEKWLPKIAAHIHYQ